MLDGCFNSPPHKLQPLLNEAFETTRTHFSNVIYFSMPGMVHFDASFYRATDPHRFPAVSVTGGRCSLNCEHCRKKILESMIPATTPESLVEVCTRIKEDGGKGCLISGGSLGDGSVPLMGFIPAIKRVKRELGLDIVVHTGIVYPELAEALAEADVDAAMIDVIGSDETLRSVYHLDLSVEAFDRSLSLLEQQGISLVPHVVVGIHYGKLKGEREALEIISKHKPKAVIIVALMPLGQTPMEHATPPSPLDIARVILAARFMIPKAPLILGCARPGGEHKAKTDVLAIKAGVSGIAYPSEGGYSFAKKAGLNVRFSEECCALIYRDLIKTRGPNRFPTGVEEGYNEEMEASGPGSS